MRICDLGKKPRRPKYLPQEGQQEAPQNASSKCRKTDSWALERKGKRGVGRPGAGLPGAFPEGCGGLSAGTPGSPSPGRGVLLLSALLSPASPADLLSWPSPPPGSRPPHLLGRQLHMQGPRGGTGRQRGGRARGWQGHRAPERTIGAHLDPRAAGRPGGQSSRIRRRLRSRYPPSLCSLETDHRRTPAARRPD